MAVQAHGLHHLLPAQPAHHANPVMAADAPFSARRPCYGGRELAAGQQGCYYPAAAGQDQYSQFLALAAVDLAQRGGALKKRKHVSSQAHQQLVDVDRLVLQHASKMWAEQRRRHMRQIVAAVEAKTAKRLRAKDEEIERIGRLNWALEERLKTIYVEAQVWRGLAHSNEAAANALRGELGQALDAQARCGENDVGTEEEEEAGASAERRGAAGGCKGCGEGAAVVLLLPCRHLCVCASCAAAARACPACGCAKNGSVCVNLS